ncbi:2OG-Fe(II) oxygenase [Cupriavidus taiwanensis]|uniref:Prolyl 4-hydroxylase alpha subunit n=1 Tax=Cupriavidus taiwanensis TaxID=164546 RepID=A0A375E2D3_9BURK|nr:2OG-Fe(II) oxygenase [Cupriavidus taiwanensis]SOZ23693.1 putative Prolyl 4-hydroxylase alpha subunit [Cupriavidus taiwanensis]SOZ56779.1 putative Prolyl 4-hydroxylase alpha subunit [Cupriavidus taiwanensis]SOZ57395.1 putative Prolyl 4-hydroxylase alpha subunit [Cupriavidus taiwanensis]SOZ60636.1 putative Prolyl 4-hydroxylase alpha subunit [Cupriavidus taiwanensis]SPA05861.1 putative Prolyl 4-hydroxylase alpha subunit [Cupriavidus taiwanensis]
MIREASVAGGKAGYTESSPELEQWLARHIAQGFAADALVLSMLRSGYDDAFARRAVAGAFAQDTGGAAPARPAPAEASAADTPAVYAADGGDRQVPVLFRLASPQVQLFQQLLSDDECDALVALSRGRLARSPVVNPDTGDENLIDARTSMGAMFQVAEHALITRIEARIAAVTGVPAEHGEGLQILNYKPGGEYQPHFDYFNPQRPGEARQLSVGGQRIATLVIYLNTPEAGGATAFPRVGLEVAPVKGNAVYFSYLLPDGTLDDRTLHAGLPVAAGEKWIATKWLRERPYRSAA